MDEKEFLEISDGKKYGINDLVRVECKDCEGCFSCCHDMDDTITVDPYDVYNLCKNLGKLPGELLNKEISLKVVEGMILPYLFMSSETGSCNFLNEMGRCSIHKFRPSICRLFPLGRIYEDEQFSYFLQIRQCIKKNRNKIKVKKWIDIENYKQHESFILSWHKLVNEIKSQASSLNEEKLKEVNMTALQLFFLTPFDYSQSFYDQYEVRFNQMNAFIYKSANE